jgi:SAM-dependent methyltransferase
VRTPAREWRAGGEREQGHGGGMSEQASLPRTDTARCWVCGGDDLSRWKDGDLDAPLASEDLRISDARYGTTLPLLHCGSCGFRFSDSDEVDRLDALYAGLDDPGYEGSQETRALQMRWLVELARTAHPDAKTALDVGAASGLLVGEARRQGLDALGIEPSASLVRVAREQAGIDLLHGVLPHPELDGRRFDLVFLVDVIEHVSDPVGLLRLCAAHLADEGRMLVVTPDASSLAARVLGRRWWHYRVAHVGYFDHSSLERALAAAGLRAERWVRARWFFTVEYLATRVETYLPVGAVNRLARRAAPLRWLYERVIPLNLFDSDAVLLRRAEKTG